MRPERVSVVVCAYTEQRWADLRAALASVRTQSRPADEVIVVVDHNPALLARARRELGGVHVVASTGPRGLSGARNTGVRRAGGEVVAFLDDDAVASRAWLARLAEPYRDPRVLGVGGAAVPRFVAGRPAWLPPEFDWVVGCSYRGQPVRPAPVRNFIGANISFRRRVFDDVGLFADGIGRSGTVPLGCEETELCIRIRQAHPGAVLLYEPAARVSHTVPASRTTWSYYRARCLAEGASKALVAGRVGRGDALETERDYVRRTLPAGLRDGLASIPSAGLLGGLGRAGAVVAGVGLAGAGYVRGRLAARRSDGNGGVKGRVGRAGWT